MTFEGLAAVIRALEERGARYLVIGGIAVNAHGHVRTTRDLDLVLAFEPENVLRALDALEELEFQPVLPVSIRDFADPDRRRQWVEERNLKVFSLVSDRFPFMPVDLLADEDFEFDSAWESSVHAVLEGGLRIRIAGLETLIKMKEEAGRHRDLDDVEHLKAILADEEGAHE